MGLFQVTVPGYRIPLGREVTVAERHGLMQAYERKLYVDACLPMFSSLSRLIYSTEPPA